jgi:type II secretory pathway component PulJ
MEALSLSLSHSLSLAPQVTWRVTSRQSFAMSDRLTRNNEINRRLKSDRDDFEDLLPESMRGDACPSLAPYDL